ncbi:MAG: MmgE/PrpD family protein [Chloroflexi bacterium]|nr:MmgE/PrpD family protein [Chloroflexota bacterium]
MDQDYLDTLCRFLAETRYEDLPAEVRQRASAVFMDTVGVIIAGSLEPEATALSQRLAGDNAGPSTVLRPGFPQAQPQAAALLNGTAGVFLELDEGHRPTGHPGVHVVPPVLALAEETGAGGRQMLEAVVLGYEVTIRLAWACNLVPGIHPHGSLSATGAAVAAARLLGFDAGRTRHALNMAACLALAPPFSAALEGATVRNVYSGMGAHNAVLVARMVESGFTGLRDGVGEVFSKYIATGFNPQRMVEGLGKTYEIATNYFKLHAACRHCHAPLDALARALNGGRLRPDEVDHITVASHYAAAACSRPDPQNPLAAKFSIPFAIATAIVQGHTGVSAFQQAAVDNPATRALARRVSVVVDEGLARRWPQENPARVKVVLKDGQSLTGEVDYPRGEMASAPGFQEEVRSKFLALTEPVFRGNGNARAMELLLGLEEVKNARELTAALRRLAR